MIRRESTKLNKDHIKYNVQNQLFIINSAFIETTLNNMKKYIVAYDALLSDNLSNIISEVYGPQGLGILFIKDIPQYSLARRQTLPLFSKLAHLPAHILKLYMKPQINYRIGWSQGAQKIQGKYDVLKGSFYNNCLRDKPLPLSSQQTKYFTAQQIKCLMAENIWVNQLPELQVNVKNLSKIMIKVGKMLVEQIDRMGLAKIKNYKEGNLSRMLANSSNFTARMLHYFPYQKNEGPQDLICGWHCDYDIITGLTSPIYVDHQEKVINLENISDFCAKNHFHNEQEIIIPPDMLAFQIGQATQIFTGGFLEATPHCVRKNHTLAGTRISRNTMACFMGPPYLEKVTPPPGTKLQKVYGNEHYKVPKLKDRWVDQILFKDLYKRNLSYYS